MACQPPTAGETASAAIQAAEDELTALAARLAEWRQSAARGQTTPDTMAAVERDISNQVTAVERRRDAAALPSDLAGWPGARADVQARWAAATVQARRSVIRTLLAVRFVSAGRVKGTPAADRIEIEWKATSPRPARAHPRTRP